MPHRIVVGGAVVDEELIDQSTVCGEWAPVGTYTFDAGTNAYVEITDAGVSDAPYIGADAVRFTSVATTQPQVCPDGMSRAALWCIQDVARAPASWVDAMRDCILNEGMELASIKAIAACDLVEPEGGACSDVTDQSVWIWTGDVGVDVDDVRYDGTDGTARAYNGGTPQAGNESDWHLRHNVFTSFCSLPINTGELSD